MPEQLQGLAKSAPSPTVSEPTQTYVAKEIPQVPSWQGIPMDIYKYLNVDFFDSDDKMLSQLKDIHDYAKSKSNGMPGDMIQKIEELQIRLGQPNIGTTRLAQLTNWIRMDRTIKDMIKQKRALEKRYA
jgi:hypothetical protein